MSFKLVTLALASLFVVGANATTTDWEWHRPLEIAVTMTPRFAFDDIYRFGLSGAQSLYGTAVANNLTDILGIAHGSVSLFREEGEIDVLEGRFDFGGDSGSATHAFGVLPVGNYFYELKGIGRGEQGGDYSLASTTQMPLAEPLSAALVLSGLAGMGCMRWRRRG